MPKSDTQFGPNNRGTPGRRKGALGKFSLAHFTRALKREAKKSGIKSAYDHVAQQFFTDNTVMIALMRKLLPDMRQVEVIKQYEGGYADMTPADACKAMDAATVGEKTDVK